MTTVDSKGAFGYLHSLVFLAGVVCIAWYYSYTEVAQWGPLSLHSWRQSDGASIARCYYENGMRFFQPKSHHVLGGDNAAAGEFPILYYVAAVFYHLFGPNDAWLRLLVFACFTAGMWAWSKLLLRYAGSWSVSLALPWAFYGSPLLAFYGFNFLPNAAALGFALLGAYGVARYLEAPDNRRLVFAGVCMGLGALLKVSQLIIPLAVMATAGWFFFRQVREQKAYFTEARHFGQLAGAVGLVVAATAAWYLWAAHYNRAHHSGLFMTTIMPIWKMPAEEVTRYAREIYLWYHDIYFFPWGIRIFLLLLPFVLLLRKPFPNGLPLFTWFMTLGTATFLLLFYNNILVHHYYIIDIMPLPMLVFSLFFWWLKERLPKTAGAWALAVLAGAFATVSLQYGQKKVYDYYHNDHYIAPFNRSLLKRKELHAFMQEKGITYQNALVVTVPDVTPNVNLYYLNTKGWNTRPDESFTDADLERYALWKATTLVVTDTAYLSKPNLEKWLAHPIGVFDNTVYFFDIRPYWQDAQ